MSIIAEVTQKLGVNREAVLRVAREGGTSSRDWDIAIAIEKAGGRSAVDTMWAARSRGPQTEAPAPANPRAIHDPEIVIYGENTSPDETRQIAPHHPGDHDEEVEDTPEQTADQLADTLLADLAEVLDDAPAAICLIRAWSTPADAHQSIVFALETDPRHWIRARYQDRLQHHLATAA